MGEITAVVSVSLDGVMQAPGRPDEDTRGGFTRGGWAQEYADAVQGEYMGKRVADGTPLLFGRRTYEDFAGFWPGRTDGNPFTPVLDAAQKYVVSRTLTEPLPWQNSTVLPDVEAVAALKATTDLTVLGCGELVRGLAGLIDTYLLQIHPLVLGEGCKLFADGFRRLRLVDSVPTTTGVIIATYRTGEA
ncbi:dihydrofolate reductase family protein [Actinokineospora soli]|uniref:Dihydrofolate reductase family protein n=1 Tax=Actinokineospora soli TaxID=1048753 RepID=A0ABW2TJA0_9PSEU